MSATDSIYRQVRRHWFVKLWLGCALTVFFCAGYFGLQRLALRPPTHLALSPVDRSIGFSPRWAWVYQSIYLLLPLAWLARSRDDLRRYAVGFILMTLTAFVLFLAWPVAGPRPAEASPGMYGVLISYDRPLNCFPSLHLGLATYTTCFALDVTIGRLRKTLSILLPIWVVLIGYSTLATRQHYFVDLPPGVFLGWAAHRLAWIGCRRPEARIESSRVGLITDAVR